MIYRSPLLTKLLQIDKFSITYTMPDGAVDCGLIREADYLVSK